jgi:hypothetical protein
MSATNDGYDTLILHHAKHHDTEDQLREKIEHAERCDVLCTQLRNRIAELEADNIRLIRANVEVANLNVDQFERIKDLEARTTWQPIESAPIGIKFIAMYGNSVGDVYFKDELTKKAYTEEFRLCLWMPLPEPPK